ncbi:MAG: SRPBCC family protein [bacterium]|nr:SRPBCC family protein [bacterium]
MIETTVEAKFNRSVEEVFAYVSRMENLGVWGAGIASCEQIHGSDAGPKAPGVGAVYRCTIGPSVPVLGMTGDYRIIAFEANRSMVCRLDSPMLSFEDTYTFEERDGGTLLRIRDQLTPPFFLALASGMLAPVIRRQLEQDCRNLERELA